MKLQKISVMMLMMGVAHQIEAVKLVVQGCNKASFPIKLTVTNTVTREELQYDTEIAEPDWIQSMDVKGSSCRVQYKDVPAGEYIISAQAKSKKILRDAKKVTVPDHVQGITVKAVINDEGVVSATTVNVDSGNGSSKGRRSRR